MKKFLLFLGLAVTIGLTSTAQKVTTKVIDNKGTIKWVLDSATAVITKADSTILYVTPTQLGDSLSNFVRYADTANMLAPYINAANNGLTKNGQTVQLGGALIQPTTITTTALITSATTTPQLLPITTTTAYTPNFSATTFSTRYNYHCYHYVHNFLFHHYFFYVFYYYYHYYL